ncbi:MAG TPA: heme-binding protein [Alphaproteobacteria bacterium]|nr:heme-binding protein [Alphaproteobacteria bacterium]
MKHLLTLILCAFLGACSLVGYNHDVKEPPFTVSLKDGAFEVREYPAIVMVKATGTGDFDTAQDESFYKLFDYISGKNAEPKEIPMTAPVLMEAQESGEGWSMAFVLPADIPLDKAPAPADPSLTLEDMKDARFAVITFSGRFTEANLAPKEQALKDWIKAQNLEESGPAIRAGYNPPWTIPLFRRNEILIPLKKLTP